MKPRIRVTPEDADAYWRVAALPEGTEVRLDGRRATLLAMTGYLITVKPRGPRKIEYLRAGDPRIREIAAQLEQRSTDATLTPQSEDK